MAIREESFRIGCGRYIQGRGYTAKVGEEVMRLGTSPLVIGGKTALALTQNILEKSIAQKCNKYEFVVHTGTCNETDAKKLSTLASQKGYDVVVGVGGGVICDFAKLCAHFAKVPVINIPTSCATCAAYTPLSVCYTPEGKTVGTRHYDYEVACVIADTEIIAAQPIRLFLAGVFDSMAKFIEIKHRFTGETTDYPIGLDYAYYMSKYSYKLLESATAQCIEDMQNGVISQNLENVIFTCLAATGVISGIARGSNQTALAHKFYEMTRLLFPESSKPHLHGEIVGVGLLLQNIFGGESDKNNHLIELMKNHSMPCSVADVGVEKTPEAFEEYYVRICNSSSIDKDNKEECEKFRKALESFWK